MALPQRKSGANHPRPTRGRAAGRHRSDPTPVGRPGVRGGHIPGGAVCGPAHQPAVTLIGEGDPPRIIAHGGSAPPAAFRLRLGERPRRIIKSDAAPLRPNPFPQRPPP